MIQRRRTPKLKHALIAAVPLAAGLMLCKATETYTWKNEYGDFYTSIGFANTASLSLQKEEWLAGKSEAKLQFSAHNRHISDYFLNIGTLYTFKEKTKKPVGLRLFGSYADETGKRGNGGDVYIYPDALGLVIENNKTGKKFEIKLH